MSIYIEYMAHIDITQRAQPPFEITTATYGGMHDHTHMCSNTTDSAAKVSIVGVCM